MNNNFIAITGNIGSGKSTALNFFKKNGFLIFSADEIVNDIYSQTNTIKLFKINKLGKFIKNNIVDKNLLKLEFFKNLKLKKQVEAIVHPLVLKQILYIKKHFNNSIVEVPLLFEAKLEKYFDLIICIYLDINEELERVSKKFKISKLNAKNILDKQIPIHKKIINSDFIIKNDSSIKNLEKKIDTASYILKKIPKQKSTL